MIQCDPYKITTFVNHIPDDLQYLNLQGKFFRTPYLDKLNNKHCAFRVSNPISLFIFQVSFRDELMAELRFIFSFSGDVKPVRHRESTGSGSGGSKGSKGSKKEEEERAEDVESIKEEEIEEERDPSPTPRSEHSHHTCHSRRMSNVLQIAKSRKYSRGNL